jgi:hypothetical protein
MSLGLGSLRTRGQINIVEPGRLHPAVSFARASTKWVLGADGTLRQVAAGVPAFEYDGDGSYLGYLCERPRTNLCTQSEFPNGVADLTTHIGSTAVSGLSWLGHFATGIGFPVTGSNVTAYKGVTLAAATTYAFSVFIRMDDGGAPVPGTSTDVTSDFLFSIGSAAVTTGFIVTPMGGGIYRVSATKLQATAGGFVVGVAKYSTQSSRTFVVSGYQLEVDSVSSYIPTAAATVTRSADLSEVADVTKIGFNPLGGAMRIEGMMLFSSGGSACRPYGFWDGTTGNRIICYQNAANNVQMLVVGNGVTSASLAQAGGFMAPYVPFRVAQAWAQDSFAITANGGSVAADSAGDNAVGITSLGVGRDNATASIPMHGYVKTMTYYPTRRPNAELQRLAP